MLPARTRRSNTSILMSSGRISTSTSSGFSGMTSNAAKECAGAQWNRRGNAHQTVDPVFSLEIAVSIFPSMRMVAL